MAWNPFYLLSPGAGTAYNAWANSDVNTANAANQAASSGGAVASTPSTSTSFIPSMPSFSTAIPSPPSSASELALIYGITNSQASSIMQVARNIGLADPRFLANVIGFESSFDPSKKNPHSSGSGLIQFMDATAKELGTTTAALRAMPFEMQMNFVQKYFQLPRIAQYGKLGTQLDVFMAVFYPKAIGQPYYDFTQDSSYSLSANHGIRTPADYYALAMKNGNVKVKFPTEYTPSTSVQLSTYLPTLAETPTTNILLNVALVAGLGAGGYYGWKFYKRRKGR